MAEKKVITQEEFIKKSDDVVLVALKLIEKMDTNKGEMGIVIKNKDFVEGKEIVDDDGAPLIDNNGQIKKFPDSYYIEFSNSTFGTFKQRVDKNIPTIFMTAYTDIQSIEKAYTLGCSDYLKKPFDFDILSKNSNPILFILLNL